MRFSFGSFLTSLFRPRCGHCGKQRGAWCAECAESLEHLPITIMFRDASHCDYVVGSGVYDSLLGDAIRTLKYNDMPSLSVPLGAKLIAALKQVGWGFDVVIPVPMHADRQKQRGYNQAALLAGQIASAFGVPHLADGLVRLRNTVPQVGLDAKTRQTNLEGAFSVRSALIGQRVLLVDDVMTTGATLSECASALRDGAVASVYGAVVATA